MGRKLTATEIARLDKLHGEKVESFLDSGAGSCYLADTRVARIVRDNLLHFDGVKYRLVAWCVMPNHVHLVLTPLSGHGLASILHSWKSYTAKKANRLLNRNGEFWQREYYDRLIGDEAEYHHTVNYVLDNPRKAGLLNWTWVDVCGNADE